ncbi:galactose-3-O-sulfotransferase 2-like isoform X2 [Ruditapes philippinarum]|nr:galactose-3-O-sulfotransferase 2-like isoform X2 [Ruditapes philippinarum]XP_060581983.1 galactose-3-O-sulfotransferase 2-like isoform X2 [Ruditapes philippinarum]XP_060582054.1 galactose-3-O-sulfotransferase 2-like isoform X2 [Ruditapes philippinarum]XP_060582138.1 galactose-3-O-sulfotransferase 2-like isoform X2 [Ruditapes philippinarum]
MKLFNKRILKSFVWVFAVGICLVVMVSLHEIAIQQKERIRTLVPSSSWIGNTIQKAYHDNITRVSENHDVTSDITHQSKPSPVTHIGFLKVHKAASTTTQAIFLRFGWRRNLTFVLSPEYNKFGYPNIISTNESITKYNTLPPPPGKTFDILCNHVVYGDKEWSTVLPSDTVMIGTIREPFGHFKSVLNYFNPRSILFIQTSIDPTDPVGTFLKNPRQYEGAKVVRHSFTNNRLAFEYGIAPEIIINRDFAAFEEYLTEVLDKKFKVVLLAEQYDESLVLMKRKLNWSLKDIMYAIKNVRSVHKEDRYVLREEHRALHRNYSIFDYLLFEFFEDRLNKQIEAEGGDFQEEVDNFKQIRKFVENFCHIVPKYIQSVRIDESRWTESFDITRSDCELMHQGEISFVQMIRKRQYGSASWKGVKQVLKQIPKNITRTY